MSDEAKFDFVEKRGRLMGALNKRGRVMSLRPFFSYYGGKWRAARLYPQPKHQTVIEPFAGSAGYSLRHHQHNVVLYDVDPVICGVWDYLILSSAKEILALPDIAPGQRVEDLHVPEEAKWLIGFWLNKGSARPGKTPSKWMRDGIRPGSFWGPNVRRTIAVQVDMIRHWRIVNRSYQDASMEEATWFVDPPYECAGKHYRFGSTLLNYAALGDWCRSLRGQVIVCENAGANWLPFEHLAHIKTTRRDCRSLECVWTRNEKGVGDETSQT